MVKNVLGYWPNNDKWPTYWRGLFSNCSRFNYNIWCYENSQFAQGEFVMLGMYTTWLLASAIKTQNLYMLIVPVFFITALIGLVVYKLLINPIVGKGDTQYISMTVGLSFFLQNMAQVIWTSDYHTVETSIKNQALNFSGFTLAAPRLVAFFVAILLVILVNIFLKNRCRNCYEGNS